MRFFILFQLLLLLTAGQVQSQIEPRGFKFVGKKKGVPGGCEAEDVAIILKELEIAKEAAEFAADHLTEYPYFWTFQAPDHPFFQGKGFKEAASELFIRMAEIADGFHTDNKFRIECRSELCQMADEDTIAATMESTMRMILPPSLWLKRPDDPVMAFCKPFFDAPSRDTSFSVASTEERLRQFRQVLDKNPENLDTRSTIVNMRSVGNTRSQVILHELAHTAYAARPIMKILYPKAKTASILTELLITPMKQKNATGSLKVFSTERPRGNQISWRGQS